MLDVLDYTVLVLLHCRLAHAVLVHAAWLPAFVGGFRDPHEKRNTK